MPAVEVDQGEISAEPFAQSVDQFGTDVGRLGQCRTHECRGSSLAGEYDLAGEFAPVRHDGRPEHSPAVPAVGQRDQMLIEVVVKVGDGDIGP